VLRATVSSDKYDTFIQSQSKAADKEAATKFTGLIKDTSSTLFSDIKWAVDTLAPFPSAIKEVGYQRDSHGLRQQLPSSLCPKLLILYHFLGL
jgi:hypothetical protein